MEVREGDGIWWVTSSHPLMRHLWDRSVVFSRFLTFWRTQKKCSSHPFRGMCLEDGSGCCVTKHHAPNTTAPDHPVKMLTEHIQQRHTITKALVDSIASHFRVTNVLGIFTATHDSLTKKAHKICTFMHKDNVHLTPAGYRLLAEEIVLDCNIISSKQQSSAKQLRTPTTPPSEEKMWRGFCCGTW